MKRIALFLVLASALTFTGCYRTVEGHAYWRESGNITGFDGQLHQVWVECRAGKTSIYSQVDGRQLEREVEAVYIGKTNIRTVERSPDGMLLYKVIYALDENEAIIDISRDVLTSVTLSSLSR
jgi:hypothetical protein